MLLVDADADIHKRLAKAHLKPDALDPWESWKIFKRFLEDTVTEVYESAAFQCGCFENESGDECFYAHFVRQFSQWDGDQDAPLRRIVFEFRYAVDDISPHVAQEMWTHDFPSLAEFASVVEGLPQFQSAMSAHPTDTTVYSEEL